MGSIDRQAAIDVAKRPVVMQGIRSGQNVTAAAVEAVKGIIVDGLRALPPVQPRIPDKIIKELTQMSNALDCLTPCNDMFPSDWCRDNCQWPEPQEQCWRRWAEKEMNR